MEKLRSETISEVSSEMATMNSKVFFLHEEMAMEKKGVLFKLSFKLLSLSYRWPENTSWTDELKQTIHSSNTQTRSFRVEGETWWLQN